MKLPDDFDRRTWDVERTPQTAPPIGTSLVIKRALLEIPGLRDDSHAMARFDTPLCANWVWGDGRDPARVLQVELLGTRHDSQQQEFVAQIAQKLGCWVGDPIGETLHPPAEAKEVFRTSTGRCGDCGRGSASPYSSCSYCGGSVEPAGPDVAEG